MPTAAEPGMPPAKTRCTSARRARRLLQHIVALSRSTSHSDHLRLSKGCLNANRLLNPHDRCVPTWRPICAKRSSIWRDVGAPPRVYAQITIGSPTSRQIEDLFAQIGRQVGTHLS